MQAWSPYGDQWEAVIRPQKDGTFLVEAVKGTCHHFTVGDTVERWSQRDSPWGYIDLFQPVGAPPPDWRWAKRPAGTC